MTSLVRNCPLAFECDRRWDDLAEVQGHEAVRYCGRCEATVHLCRSQTDFRQHQLKGHCVALDLGYDSHRVGEPAGAYGPLES